MDLTEMLKSALDSGIIDPVKLQEQIEMYENLKYLEMHPYEIWQGKNTFWYTYLPVQSVDTTAKRKLVKKKTEQLLKQAIVKYYKGQETTHLISDVFIEWINEKSEYGEILQQTKTRYLADYNRYFKGGAFERKDIKQVTFDDIESFVKLTIRDKKLSSKAWRNMKIILKGTFRYAKKKKYTSLSITDVLDEMDIPKKIFKPAINVTDDCCVFREDELKKLKCYIDQRGARLTDMAVLLAMATGMRVGEIVVLKKSDIHEKYIDVNKTEIRYRDDEGVFHTETQYFTKTDAGLRKVFIPDYVQEIIREINCLNDSSDNLFGHDGVILRSNSVSKRLKKLCEYVGIVPKSVHKIRRTYATRLINNNVDDKIIMKQMGHTDITTTRKYYLYNDKTETEGAEQIQEALLHAQ